VVLEERKAETKQPASASRQHSRCNFEEEEEEEEVGVVLCVEQESFKTSLAPRMEIVKCVALAYLGCFL
jgi:hypothetical protein